MALTIDTYPCIVYASVLWSRSIRYFRFFQIMQSKSIRSITYRVASCKHFLILFSILRNMTADKNRLIDDHDMLSVHFVIQHLKRVLFFYISINIERKRYVIDIVLFGSKDPTEFIKTTNLNIIGSTTSGIWQNSCTCVRKERVANLYTTVSGPRRIPCKYPFHLRLFMFTRAKFFFIL